MPAHLINRFLLLIAMALLAVSVAHAQAREPLPEGTVRIQLVDGTTVVGVIQSEDEESVVLMTRSGISMTIPREQIMSTTSIAGARFARIDPNRTRLLFGPTGRSLEVGRGYFSAYEIFFPLVSVGAGSGVTMAGGISINPGSGRLIYVAPKVTVYERSNAAVAVGAFGVGGIGSGGSWAGMVFGAGTYGGPELSATVGVGMGFLEDSFAAYPLLMIGAERQVSNSVKLITENYLYLGETSEPVFSFGVRFFGDRLAADLALVTFPALIETVDVAPVIPWIGFAFNF